MNRPCPDMQDRVIDFLLGALDADAMQGLQEHLDRCPTAGSIWTAFGAGASLVGLGREVSVDMDARQARVVEALAKVAPTEAGTGRVFPCSADLSRRPWRRSWSSGRRHHRPRTAPARSISGNCRPSWRNR